ncbi:protein YgfX [Pseudomonas alliivorans]|uniref:protein YgfX n=1 Tax=Pseudomonas fragariae (ex Marin et al. 2024) TaxID=3080056 RepID=UPI002ED5A081|nr:protein YgfX [Pseudomonas alliivorans]MEE4887797.1 protein YgfX [Pseudomonas alliivorans]MEE4905380.1 protein YgfX [Pseudomonas alliivorans]MEE5067956.1 protein YgfX [Pseudomonas alliivorans]
MFSPNDRFECRWQASRLLLTAYALVQVLSLSALYWLDVPVLIAAMGAALCVAHAAWVLPASILLKRPGSFTGLQRDSQGWRVWSERGGWQPVQLCKDSLALPLVVILRFRLVSGGRPGRQVHSCCIPFDAQAPDIHRRLRVRLKFSRRRWVVSE